MKHVVIKKLSYQVLFVLFILVGRCFYFSLAVFGLTPVFGQETIVNQETVVNQEAASNQEIVSDQDLESANYVIGPHDVLSITVWNHGDLSREVSVAANGYFSFPLIGSVKASDLTVKELENTLAEVLNKDYIVDPQVTIQIKDFKSKKVFILGEIPKPGAYYLSKIDTLLEVISNAGGVTNNAGREITIVRPAEGTSEQQPASLDNKDNQLIHIDLQALLDGDLEKNVSVQNNDTIYVPRADVFSIFGNIGNPGTYTLNKEISIVEAISNAGGPSNGADMEHLELSRKEGDEQKKIILNFHEFLEEKEKAEEFLIRNGDVIYIREAKYFTLMGEVINPGTHEFEEGMTVIQAIMTNGGFSDKASKGKIKILRFDEEGQQVKLKVEHNELVQPQDIIEVSQRFF